MRKMILSLSLLGTVLTGGIAAADEGYGRDRTPEPPRVEVRDHRADVRHDDRRVDDRRVNDRRVDDRRDDDRRFNERIPVVAPPVAPVERESRAPGRAYIRGEYQWQGGRYVFVPGHYVREFRGYHWVGASWARVGRSFVKMPGHWERG